MEEIEPNPTFIRVFFFLAGIIATLSYRIIIILNFINPLLVQVAWYTGTIGFIIYFWHRYAVQRKRARLVEKYDLVELAKETPGKTEEQGEALTYIVKTSLTSRSRWNSMFIFVTSVLALLVGIVLDLGLASMLSL